MRRSGEFAADITCIETARAVADLVPDLLSDSVADVSIRDERRRTFQIQHLLLEPASAASREATQAAASGYDAMARVYDRNTVARHDSADSSSGATRTTPGGQFPVGHRFAEWNAAQDTKHVPFKRCCRGVPHDHVVKLFVLSGGILLQSESKIRAPISFFVRG